MAHDLSKILEVGISSWALFDLSTENQVYEEQGLAEYSRYQREHEDTVLEPGTAFHLARAILRLNEVLPGERRAEVIVMSRNSYDTGLRVFNSIQKHGLNITRAAFTSGTPLANYLSAYGVGLFLSAEVEQVK